MTIKNPKSTVEPHTPVPKGESNTRDFLPPALPADATPHPLHKGLSKLVQIKVSLPLATLKMLESEATLFNWRRSQFLEALIRHKVGSNLRITRDANAPTYQFSRQDWSETERFVWYLRPELKKGFDELRMRSGNISAAAWIVLAVNEWVGLPTGFDGSR